MVGDYSKLSDTQREVLDMLTKDYEIPKRIALRRKTSIRAVYKTIKILQKKGVLTRGFTRFTKNQSTQTFKPPKSLKTYIRLHGQEWNIKILYKSRFYEKITKNKIFFIDGNTVRLYKDSLEVYSNELLKFEAEDEWRATALSFNYWNKMFTRLENKFKIIIIKEGYSNISQVKHEYAEVGNELAKEYNEKKLKLNIYTTDDGKLWFKIDHSWNFDEAETSHTITAKPDMTKVKAYFNDIRDNPEIPIPSKSFELSSNNTTNISQLIGVVRGNQDLINGLPSALAKLEEEITSHLKLIQEYRKENIRWRKHLNKKSPSNKDLRKWV